MKKLLIFSSICILAISCIKESPDLTNTKATLTNRTQYLIKILFYKGGIVYPDDTIKLSPNNSVLFADEVLKGKFAQPAFGCRYFGSPTDSIVVEFNNIYKMTHYATAPLYKARRFYLFSSLRNIANPKSYRFVSSDIDKNTKLNEHFYEFVEQDYLDAL